MTETERWRLEQGGRVHEVTLADRDVRREITWSVDGEQVATTVTSDERVVLTATGHGAVGLRLPTFLGPARRVTWWDGEGVDEGELAVRAHAGVGGSDFEAVSEKARAREEWIRAHPRAYAARRTLAAVAKVVLPILLLWLLARVALPAIPWPQIPWPQIRLPAIPWPQIPWPDIPWPDIRLPRIVWPDWQVPAWVRQVLEYAKYVVPVLVAASLAHAELRRRRTQDEERRRRQELERSQGDGPTRSLEA